MRVAIVGSTGNVGSAVSERLAHDPAVTEVVAFARRPPGTSLPKTRFVALDIVTDDLAPHLADCDALVHLAWAMQPTHRPIETWRTNIGGTSRVLDAVAATHIGALVYASSVGAYSPAPGQEVDESYPTDGLPTAAYGREKAYVERMLDAFEARHPATRVVRLRTAFVFQRAAATQQRRLFGGPFVPSSLLRKAPIPTGLRFQALHATDAASAYQLALSRDVRGAFNVAAEPPIDGAAIAALLGTKALPIPPKLIRTALATAWHARLVPSEPALFDLALGLPLMKTDRARDELGWQPAISATDAVEEMLSALMHGEGGDSVPLAPDSLARRIREL